MLIGERGIGKGAVIRAIRDYILKKDDVSRRYVNADRWYKYCNIKPEYVTNLDTVTLRQLAQVLFLEPVKDTTLYWTIEEYSLLQDYHRKMLLSIGSKLITERELDRTVGNYGETRIKIKNCDLVMSIAIQPNQLQDTIQSEKDWESLANDRFIKFSMFNPLKNFRQSSGYPQFDFVPTFDSQNNITVLTDLRTTRELFEGQISYDRLPLLAESMIKAYCQFEGYDHVGLIQELEFRNLMWPYVRFFADSLGTYLMSNEPNIRNADYKLLDWICKFPNIEYIELQKKLRLQEKPLDERGYYRDGLLPVKQVMYYANRLKQIQYIDFKEDSPATFNLSPKLQAYFDWYQSLVC